MENSEDQRAANDQRYVEAKAHVVSAYIKNSRPGRKKILLIIDKANNNLGGFLTSKLDDMGVKNVCREVMLHASANDDKMISESGLAAAEASSIDEAWNKHKDASWIVIAGFSPSARSLEEVKNIKNLTRGRVKIFLISSGGLSKWMYHKIDEEIVDAVIIVDNSLPVTGELPENINDVFKGRYVLINKSNLERNRRFLPLD